MFSDLLLIFSVLFMCWAAAEIFLPFLRRKRDLVNFYSVFMFGCFLYVGVSGFDYSIHMRQYAPIRESAFMHFEIGAIVFFGTLAITYRNLNVFDRLARRNVRLFPTLNNNLTSFIIPCLMLASIQLVGRFHFVLGYMGAILSFNSMVVLSILAFCHAKRGKTQGTWILFTILFALSFYVSMSAGTGRRRMISCLAVLPIGIYWFGFRDSGTSLATLNFRTMAAKLTRSKPKSRFLIVTKLIIASVVFVLLLNGYSGVRHRIKNSGSAGRTLSYNIQNIIDIPKYMFRTPDTSQMLGQHAVNLSLTIIDRYYLSNSSTFQPVFLHSLYFVAVNPVPRRFWPEKPESLGVSYPREAGYWKRGYVNVGPGIVGHCFHDGGWLVLVLYGIIGGSLLRFFDQLLINEKSRILTAGLLAAAVGPVMGMGRGCIAVFFVEFLTTVAAVVAIVVFRGMLKGFGVVR